MFKVYPNKSAMDSKRGRYLTGGDTDVFSNRLGWWERDISILERRIDDITYLITKADEFKPSAVAFAVYKTTDLEWLVLLYNNIIDINEEFTAGTYLTLPSYQRAVFEIAIK